VCVCVCVCLCVCVCVCVCLSVCVCVSVCLCVCPVAGVCLSALLFSRFFLLCFGFSLCCPFVYESYLHFICGCFLQPSSVRGDEPLWTDEGCTINENIK